MKRTTADEGSPGGSIARISMLIGALTAGLVMVFWPAKRGCGVTLRRTGSTERARANKRWRAYNTHVTFPSREKDEKKGTADGTLYRRHDTAPLITAMRGSVGHPETAARLFGKNTFPLDGLLLDSGCCCELARTTTTAMTTKRSVQDENSERRCAS